MNENASIIDDNHTAYLGDVGSRDYIAATAISADGSQHLVLAELASLGDENVRCNLTCPTVTHDQTGPLPIEFVRRVTVSRRMTHRCGRQTKSGNPCKIRVSRAGDACEWHASQRKTA
jgi:hypothetical protein